MRETSLLMQQISVSPVSFRTTAIEEKRFPNATIGSAE
jgi:hypothetical protein